MISDEKIKEAARIAWPELPDHWWDRQDGSVWKATSTFARAIYEQGRADQRESDADLCESLDQDHHPDGTPRQMQYVCADAIRNNTGDIPE